MYNIYACKLYAFSTKSQIAPATNTLNYYMKKMKIMVDE